MYNQLNADYPKKPDLRKCLEFKRWKNCTAIEQGKETVKIRARKPYRYCIAPYDNIIINPGSPTKKQQQKTMQLSIELMSVPRYKTCQETVVEQSGPPSAPQESGPPSAPQESNPPSAPEEQPLPEPLPEPTGDEQPLPEPLPGPAEDNIDPYKPAEEIPPAIIEKIISELRLDPQLSAIMDEVETGMQDQEQSLELDIPELEIDIPELDQIFDQDDIFW